MTKPKPKPDDAVQSARFIEAAKRAEVDRTGEGFEKAFKKIAPEKRRLGSSVDKT
jgi:hypothetical protein